MTTAGGLVFFGNDAEAFEAVDAQSGKSLWHFNTGQTMHASPMSYAVKGKAIRCNCVRQRSLYVRAALTPLIAPFTLARLYRDQ